MKAFMINQYGKTSKGYITHIPEPEIGKNDVLVEIHAASLNPLDLKNSIQKNMNDTVAKFSDVEQKNYTDAIVALRRENSDIFQDFKLSKQKEIDKLQEDVKNSEKELGTVGKQLEEFKQTIKE